MRCRHEVRANAFAGRFLMPTEGVERHPHSIDRDTVGPILWVVPEVFSNRSFVPKAKSWVRVSSRARLGAETSTPWSVVRSLNTPG